LGEFRKDDFKNSYIEKCMKVIHNRNPYSINHPVVNSGSHRSSASKPVKVAHTSREKDSVSVVDQGDSTKEIGDEVKDGVESLEDTRTVSEELIETIGTWKTQRAAKHQSPAPSHKKRELIMSNLSSGCDEYTFSPRKFAQ
jgi:hypothetical protein